tara:strand:+ start:1178 stop:3580 length:2403 start_codon:yes stop_codon:yes gene_type:complete
MLISKSIPNLINGVSQQPDSLRFSTQCESQVNAYPSIVDGLTKRYPTEHVKALSGLTTGAKTFTHFINRDSTEQYVVVLRDEEIKVYDLDGNPEDVDTPDGVSYLNTDNADTAFRAVTIADVTFILNTEDTVETTGATPSSAAAFEALIFIKQGSTSGDYVVTIKDGTNTETAKTVGATGVLTTDATSIATAIDTDNTNFPNLTAAAAGSVVYVSSASDFTITSTYTKSTGYIETFKESAQTFTDLPNFAKDGMILKIDGSPTDNIDDYYVKFVTNAVAGSIGEGLWEECPAPALANGLGLNPASMPHVLIRQANNEFVFQKADGTAHDGYDYSAFGWTSRLVGDFTTNPDPSFVGLQINDIFLFKNRLGFLAGENIVLSESGEYFNFFRTTVTDLLDSDLIDVAAAHTQVATLKHAVPFSENLILFSDFAQFILQGGTTLTPKTVSMAQISNYENLPNCTPLATATSIYFGFKRGGSFSGVREYLPTSSDTDKFEGLDIAAHVPKYIPGNIKLMAAATHENVLVALSDSDPDALYLYNYYQSGRERIQSAWHQFEFGTDTEVYGMEFIDTDLFIVCRRTEGVFLEKMAFEAGKTDSGSTYVTSLDRRLTNTSTGVSLSSDTLTIPYKKSAGRTIEIYTAAGQKVDITTQTNGSNELVLKDATPLASGVYYIGEAYEMSYQFSDLTIKQNTPAGGRAIVTDGRVQIRYGTLVYDESGYFQVEVTPDFRDTSTHKFTGRILGSNTLLIGSTNIDSGEYRFPVFSKANQTSIIIKNDKPVPSNLMSAEFEINFSPRTRRIDA